MESKTLEYLSDYGLIACLPRKRYPYLRYKIQIDQRNLLPENVRYVSLLQRPLESQYCDFQQLCLSYADVKGRKTNTKSQAYCFIRFMLMITEIIKIDKTTNLQRNSHISCFISKVLNSIMNLF